MQVLLSTTSFQDTPGAHHDVLESANFKLVRARGPLNEDEMLGLIEEHGGFDAFLNGDDDITAKVIDASLPRLQVIAKYGIGLDKIDVDYATAKKLPVLFTPGVNHTTVAEHCFGLMIASAKQFWWHMSGVKEGGWRRQTGRDLAGKTLGIIGLGRIGKEVIKRASAFDMNCIAFTRHWPEEFCAAHNVQRAKDHAEVIQASDFLSLHCALTDETRELINKDSIATMKDGSFIINTARGGVINEADVAEACKSGKLSAYAADVLDIEPMQAPHPFQEIDNIILTPHIGSRTHESVGRQAMRAVKNLINFLNKDSDYIQFNQID